MRMKFCKNPAAPLWLRIVLAVLIGVGITNTICLLNKPVVITEDAHRTLVVNELMKRTVKVVTARGSGTGTMVTRRTADGTVVHLVWTAAHVVQSCRSFDTTLAGPKVRWAPCMVLIPKYQNGELVSSSAFVADVVQYSNSDIGMDLAILRVRAATFPDDTTEFYLDKELPPVGQDLIHVGCMFGDFHSFTTGVLSQYGRTVGGKIFDQITTLIYPGSSGGGVYLPDGRYVGMASMLRTSGVGLITPIRHMIAWATKTHCLWALDSSVQMPNLATLNAWPIESDGEALPPPPATLDPMATVR